MTSDQRSGFDPPRTDVYMLGELSGRVRSVEDRLGRYEAKIDGIDGKIDAIQKALAERAGISAAGMGLIKWGVAVVSAAGAWFGAFHFGGSHN